MSESQSPSQPDIGKRVWNDVRALMQAHMRGDRSVCARCSVPQKLDRGLSETLRQPPPVQRGT